MLFSDNNGNVICDIPNSSLREGYEKTRDGAINDFVNAYIKDDYDGCVSCSRDEDYSCIKCFRDRYLEYLHKL